MPRYSSGQPSTQGGFLALGLWAATIMMILAVLLGIALVR